MLATALTTVEKKRLSAAVKTFKGFVRGGGTRLVSNMFDYLLLLDRIAMQSIRCGLLLSM